MSDNAPSAGTAHRRSSITQAALSNLFQRGPSNANVPPLPGAPSMTDPRGRRLSVSTIGLSGSSPTNAAAFVRRESVSTNSNSGSMDESAIEDDDFVPGSARTAPNTPFVRRMSFGASAGSGSLRGYRPSGSPGNDQQGFNWSEQLRSRAESSVAGARPSFSLASGSPPRMPHDRARSVSEMAAPPNQAPPPPPPRQEKPKPDAFQERILKGDFYMD
ncbi:hypothetical protein LMH87_005046 [Akanthomyces muscarius]|uniref:Uncharacterized protein n=1 Tax=Akanthomyces muscarius TaxID=2231603 RepID=A0A9W8QJX8_AKAMU|nr:hypothetical protein LMH87_005046 [Akanthomyces muscarius]KAJ4163308.1 hypothetical protein LMH87_005046 [Akanthomyces muscarius]